MTLREELYNTVVKVREEKAIKEREQHIKEVEQYLKFICRKAALEGDFEVFIRSVKLKDDLCLTSEDVEYFAMTNYLDFKENNIPFAPQIIAILSFRTAKKDNV